MKRATDTDEKEDNMRVCVCISGQMRSAIEALSEWQKIAANHDVTFIFSVWDRIGRKIDGALNINQLERMLDSETYYVIPNSWHGSDVFWKKLPALRADLTPSNSSSQASEIEALIRRFLPDAIIDIECEDLLDLKFRRPRDDTYSKMMTYKIWRANEIKRAIERRSEPFDVVIRTRPDLVFTDLDLDHIFKQTSAGRLIVSQWEPNTPWVNDVFAIGSSEALDCYAAIFSRAIEQPENWSHIHNDLAQHLAVSGIEINNEDIQWSFASDKKIDVKQLSSALSNMKTSSLGWDASYEIVFACCQAEVFLLGNRPSDALSCLKSVSGKLDTASTVEINSYLTVLAHILDASKDVKGASICALSAYSSLEDDYIRNRIFDRLFVNSFKTFVLQAADSGVNFEAWLTSDLPEDWLLPIMQRIGEQDWLSAAIGNMFSRASNVASLSKFVEKQLKIEGNSGFSRSIAAASTEPLVDTDFLYSTANALKKTGHYETALAIQLIAFDRQQDHPGSARQLAELSLCAGNVDQALLYANLATSLLDTPKHRALLAFCEYMKNPDGHLSGNSVTFSVKDLVDYTYIPHCENFMERHMRRSIPNKPALVVEEDRAIAELAKTVKDLQRKLSEAETKAKEHKKEKRKLQERLKAASYLIKSAPKSEKKSSSIFRFIRLKLK